jgi:hypothetical protein
MSELRERGGWRGFRGVRWLKASPAVLDAEVRLVANALAPYGVLSHAALAEHCDAGLWHEGTFDAALQAGVERGVLKLLPGGSVELVRPWRSRRRRRRDVVPPPSADGKA